MKNITIKTHAIGVTYKGPHVFALSKGYNIGKPLEREGPNAFAIILENENDKSLMIYVLEGLWRTGKFKEFMHGSVIDTIRIKDFSKIVIAHWNHICTDEQRVLKLQEAYNAISILNHSTAEMTRMLNVYRMITFHTVLKINTEK